MAEHGDKATEPVHGRAGAQAAGTERETLTWMTRIHQMDKYTDRKSAKQKQILGPVCLTRVCPLI